MEAVIADIKRYFRKLSLDEPLIHISRFPRDAIIVIRSYFKGVRNDETVRVYAVGGDGILFDCLNGVVGLANAELAIVPYGRTNDMVRAFGENKNDLFQDISLQATSPAIPTDIIYCGSVYALNLCTVGVESDAVLKTITINHHLENRNGIFPWLNDILYHLIYYLGGIQAIFNKPVMNQHYNLTIDGEKFTGQYCSINIANGPCYGGDKNAVVTAMPDDGFLDVLFFKSMSSLRMLGIMIPYTKGRYTDYPGDFIWKRVRKVVIHSDAPLYIDLDGEIFFDTNITVEVVPAAVKIVAVNGLQYIKMAEPDEKIEARYER